jgi:hypothetical protein
MFKKNCNFSIMCRRADKTSILSWRTNWILSVSQSPTWPTGWIETLSKLALFWSVVMSTIQRALLECPRFLWVYCFPTIFEHHGERYVSLGLDRRTLGKLLFPRKLILFVRVSPRNRCRRATSTPTWLHYLGEK